MKIAICAKCGTEIKKSEGLFMIPTIAVIFGKNQKMMVSVCSICNELLKREPLI